MDTFSVQIHCEEYAEFELLMAREDLGELLHSGDYEVRDLGDQIILFPTRSLGGDS